MPTKVSALENDSGYQTAPEVNVAVAGAVDSAAAALREEFSAADATLKGELETSISESASSVKSEVTEAY